MSSVPSSDKIRLLIVDDIPEMRENIRKLLAFEPDVEVIGVAGNGNDAIQSSRTYQPNIVLMDVNMPDMDGITAAERIVQAVPIAQVIMVSVQHEPEYLRKAMLAGARDFVTKPFSAEELISTIRRVHKMAQARMPVMPVTGPTTSGFGLPAAALARPPKQGKIIATFGTKGGIGTSMVAVNLAIALSRADNKVALVDASLHFGDVGVMLNLQATRSIADISKIIADLDAELIETMLTPHVSGVKALLAPGRPEMADVIIPDHIKSILAEMREMFDFVVVDTTRSLKDETLVVLDAADRIVLLGTPDIPSIKNARTFFEIADALRYPASKIVYVLNKVDRRSVITAKDIEGHVKHPVAAQFPMDEATAVGSVNRGVPFAADPRTKSTPLTQSIHQLADRLVTELQPVEEPVALPIAERAKTPEDVTRERLGRIFNRG
jgi:pilus assembly protein CpaE